MKTDKKFRNSFDWNIEMIKPAQNKKPSLTVPNMALSLKDLITRFTRGGEVSTFNPVYQDHDDFDEMPDLQKLDPMEKLDLAREIKQSISQKQAEMAKKDTAPKAEPPKSEPPAEPSPSPTPPTTSNP